MTGEKQRIRSAGGAAGASAQYAAGFAVAVVLPAARLPPQPAVPLSTASAAHRRLRRFRAGSLTGTLTLTRTITRILLLLLLRDAARSRPAAAPGLAASRGRCRTRNAGPRRARRGGATARWGPAERGRGLCGWPQPGREGCGEASRVSYALPSQCADPAPGRWEERGVRA